MILSGLSPASRIWIFQSDRVMNEQEEEQLSAQLKDFISGWKAHGVELLADAEILHSSVVVVGVDESKEPPSGCSIDKAFGVLKSFGGTHAIDFFNRLLVNISYCNSAKILTRDQVQQCLMGKELTSESLVFNSLAQTVGDLRSQTYLALGETWMAPKLNFQ